MFDFKLFKTYSLPLRLLQNNAKSTCCISQVTRNIRACDNFKVFPGRPTRSYTCPGFIFVDSSLLCLFPRVSQPYIFPLVFGYEERQSPFPSRLPILGFSVLSHGESIFCCVEAHGPNTKQRWTSTTNGREFCSWTARLEGKPWAKGCETFENLGIFALFEHLLIFD